ncbi:MAG TPA: hypothetical protein VGO62_19720 [Myxococcota bacterium]|jgi:hypothetical protein
MRVALFLAAVGLVAGAAAGCKKSASVEDGAHDAGTIAVDSKGQREIEHIQYNDVTDVYRLFLVGRPNPNEPQRVQFLRLAHMSDADVAAGKKPHLKIDGGGPIAFIGSTFSIGILHGVVEQRADPASGNNVSLVARTERKGWTPFGGKKLIDGADPYTDPAFYYPPPLHDGPLFGFGGRGSTKPAAAENYRAQNGALPQAVIMKTTGYQSATEGGALVDAGAPFPIIPPDPTSGLSHRVIGAAPGSRAAAKQHAKKRNATAPAPKKHP